MQCCLCDCLEVKCALLRLLLCGCVCLRNTFRCLCLRVRACMWVVCLPACTHEWSYALGHWYWIPTVRAICLTLTQQLTVTPSEKREEKECVCVCVHNTGCETVFVCCRINFGIHTVFMWTWLLLWRCWPLAEGIHIHSGTLAMHSLHNTHSFYSQREPRVCPLAPGQADLWPLKTPGHSCKTSAGKRRRQDNVNPRAAVNI